MLQFDEVVNLRDEICKGVLCEEWYKSSGEELMSETVWLVGRENGGIFLFRYNTCLSSSSQSHSGPGSLTQKRTHIGMCNLAENMVKTLLSIDKEEDVVQCSISEQAALLVFCIASDGPIKTRSATNRDMRLYIADVQQGVRRNVIPMEIVAERLENTKSAQFIHGTRTDGKMKLLVFEHCEYIGVLTFSVDSTGKLRDRKRKYKPDWIIGKHFWYQWDVDKQHLYTIVSEFDKVVLVAYQTSDKITLQQTFSTQIEVNSRTARPRLSRLNLEQRSQDRNIVILSNFGSANDGMLCLCNQVPYNRRDKSDSDQPFTLQYEILSLTHGKKFTVSVTNVPGKHRKMCIHFTLIGHSVLAYLPDVFTHLLNVQDITDLGLFNIICPGESHSRVADFRGILSRVHLPQLRRNRTGFLMYDSSSMCIYHMSLGQSALLELFSQRWISQPHPLPVCSTEADLTNQLAVLQHVLQTTADVKRSRQLLECMAADVTSSHTVTALTEFILGSSFAVASRRSEMSKVFCMLLPFTCAKTERIHKVSVGEGDRQRSVTIELSECSTKTTISNEANIAKDCHFFVFLHLACTRRPVKRFDVSAAQSHLRQNSSSLARNKPTASLKQRLYSFVRKETPRFSGHSISSDGWTFTAPPVSDSFPDLLLNEDVDDSLVSGLANALLDYVKDCYSEKTYKDAKPSPAFVVDTRKQLREFEIMCWSYAKILVNQVKVLLHHLYTLFGLKDLPNKQYATQSPSDMYKAFTMFERYQFAVQELGLPLPKEFPTLLTTVAYQSLHPVEFMQYVSNGVLELTDEFLDVLAADKNPSKVSVKSECLARMSQQKAINWSLKLMDSPVIGGAAMRLVAEDIFTSHCSASRTKARVGAAHLRFGGRRIHDNYYNGGLPTEFNIGGDDAEEEYDADIPHSYRYLVRRLTASGWVPGTNGVSLSTLERAVFYHTTAPDH